MTTILLLAASRLKDPGLSTQNRKIRARTARITFGAESAGVSL